MQRHGALLSGRPNSHGNCDEPLRNDDRRNDDASFGDQAERFSRKLSDSAQQVWLAGLGALGVQAEGSRFFDGLVKEGWEARRAQQRTGPGLA